VPLACPACAHDNADGSRFCGECGASLAPPVSCASCGHANPAEQKFCNGCGKRLEAAQTIAAPSARSTRPGTPSHLADKILRARDSLQGERKQITVLFVDVKGSMDLAEQLGAEEWHAILDRFFQILTDGVHRFEGSVNQYTGDGIMALFGAPIAHEDHAQRACWAALHLQGAVRAYADELRRTQGLSFSTRMGINSGDVVIGRIGDDLRMDYTAQGHTVGLAQRMEQLAEPGTICLTEHTRRLVEGYFRLRELGPVTIKGASAPLEVAVLEGVGQMHTRLDVSRARGFSRFVGRAREMEALQGALASALDGSGQIAGVVGDAGVGKSRLCHEFLESCRARGIPVWRAHCPSHGRAIPLLPILELTRDFFGIDAQDSPAEARRKIAGTLALLDDALVADLPVAFDFLQVPDPAHPLPPVAPEAHQLRLLSFLGTLFRRRSEQQPAVLFLDDLHWIDADSDALLARMVGIVTATRTLLLLNFRPEYRAEWMARSDYRRIPVLPLGDDAIGEMLAELLGGDASVVPLRDRLCDRARGNPFFAEELVLALASSGALEGSPGAYRLVRADDAAIPPTVQGILAARIDRLGHGDKQVLQAAAVIGREFGLTLLARMQPAASEESLVRSLDALQRAELVYETALYPAREYVFKHPLTHEVAYGTQLQEARARSHAAVARALAALDSDRQDERAALIAHHFASAGERREAAAWYARAARWDALRSPTTTIQHWRRIRELLADAEDEDALRQRAEACREILFTAWRAGLDASEWEAVYEEGTALARRLDDKAGLAMLLSSAAVQRAFSGELHAQVELLEEALELARAVGDFALEASLQQRIGWAWGIAGDNHRDREWTERALRFCARDPARAGRVSGFDTLAWLHGQHAWGLTWAGRFAEAEQALARGDAAANAVADEFSRFNVRGARHHLAWLRLDHAAMAAATDDPDALWEGVRPYALASGGLSRMAAGDLPGAVAAFAETVAGFAAMRSNRQLSNFLSASAMFAHALALQGDRERARAVLDDVRGWIARRPDLRRNPLILRSTIPAVLVVDGAAAGDEITGLIDALLRAARERGYVVTEPFALQYRAELAALRGDAAASVRDLRAAAELFRALDCTVRADELDTRAAPAANTPR
jgi:class 3 adenylate cyclase